MIKWIRRSSLIFIFILLLTVITLWIFSGKIIKIAVEEVGTQVLGAQVNVHEADITLSPFGFQLNGLQVTNPDQPMQNMVEMNRVHADVQLLQLLAGQIIIHDLSAQGVEFNTVRQQSGAIEKPQDATEKESKEFDFSSVKNKLPNIDDVLAKETLLTTEKSKALKAATETSKTRIETAIADIPEEAHFKAYETRLKELTSEKNNSIDELNKRKQALKLLKDDIRADKTKIESLRDEVKQTKSNLSDKYADLKSAPKQDIQNLRQRYSLDSAGAANLTGLLFGDDAKLWLSRIQTWHQQLNELMPKASDNKTQQATQSDSNLFEFARDKSLPQFLIHRTALATTLPMGTMDITISNITHQPHILGKPIELNGKGVKLEKAESIFIDGVIDHVNPANSRDALNWKIKSWQLSDLTLSESETLSVSIKRAIVDVQGNANVLSGGKIQANFDSQFQSTEWLAPASEGWSDQVTQMLSEIPEFKMQGNIDGNISSPKLSLKSDLDKKVKQRASEKLKAKQKVFEENIQARLNDEVENATGPYKEQLALLNKTEGSLDERINQLETMLKSQMQSAVDSQKQEAEQKLKDGLQDKLKGFGF